MAAPRFADRDDAGRQLSRRLVDLADDDALIVLGLPRGGVVVAARVAEALHAPLGVLVARKLRTPGAPELAMGAVAVWGGHRAVSRIDSVIARARVSADEFRAALDQESAEARRRADEWGQRCPELRGRTVVVVDDGLATGATMRAALEVVGRAGARRVIAAVPVGPAEELRDLGAETVAVDAPERFGSVGAHYRDFEQVDDAVVSAALAARPYAG
jgi:predicted phosphoribosyltransferase